MNDFAGLFDGAVAAGADARAAANWLTGEITAHLNRTGESPVDLAIDAAGLAELVGMIEDGDLSATAAKDVLNGVLAGEGSPRQVATSRDLIQISDESAIGAEVDAVLDAHSDEVERIRGGEDRLIGFLVGQVMKATGGKADPRLVDRLIRERVS
jgi:aspartyl-tRNA(Asn)/glutamyl-tRNA(Gln) amidotransferase subunit B